MGREGALRTSLVCLGAAVALVGLYTFSFKKMVATYVFGILAICGVLLPDWEFFDRDFSQWFSPMPTDRPAAAGAAPNQPARFKFYPLRVSLFVAVYGFGLYKWWNFMSS
uniref:Putative signal peptidase complex subunit 1 n=1 Tax=Anthurium amnicola TaxID=1678845 RepID=A0A1D1XJW8_9ARAE